MMSRVSLFCATAWLFFAVSSLAQGTAEDGALVFQQACAGCHGAEGRGDGPTAALLSIPVPDLTGFARRNDGFFDPVQVVRFIDGREGMAAHGGPMPMFGGLLTGPSVVIDAKDGSPVSTTQAILSVVLWLEAQQQ